MTTIRELKKDAKVRLSGNYFKLIFIYAIYSIVIYAFSALAKLINSNIIKFLYLLLLLVFAASFSFGLISCIMDIIRGKKTSFTEFINIGFKNMSKSCAVFLRILLKLLIPIILLIASMYFVLVTLANAVTNGPLANYFILSMILLIVTLIFLLIRSLYYSFSFYLLKDKKEKSSKEIVNMSHDLIKGNIVKIIGLTLSFIGWYLLIFAIALIASYFLPQEFTTIITEIGSMLLFPYITTTMIGFYEDVLYDKTHAEETAQ